MTEQGEYEGMWKRDVREGQGIMKWSDGSRFEGEWKDDMRKRGKMFMQDGNIYEGEFMNDKYHGLGTLTMKIQGGSSS